jgi:hypothetical protein
VNRALVQRSVHGLAHYIEVNMKALTTKLRKFNIVEEDNEWDELYRFQKSYRREQKITASDLLERMGIRNLNLTHYLYSDLKRPSKRPGTVSVVLRDKLREFKEEIAAAPAAVASPASAFHPSDKYLLEEILEDRFGDLNNLGVSSMNLEGDTVVVHTLEKKFNQPDFERFLEGTWLADKTKDYVSNSYLAAFGSPICTKTDLSGYGT